MGWLAEFLVGCCNVTSELWWSRWFLCGFAGWFVLFLITIVAAGCECVCLGRWCFLRFSILGWTLRGCGYLIGRLSGLLFWCRFGFCGWFGLRSFADCFSLRGWCNMVL